LPKKTLTTPVGTVMQKDNQKKTLKTQVGTVTQKDNIAKKTLTTPVGTVIWGDIFESSKLKARTFLLPRFSEKRRSSFEL